MNLKKPMKCVIFDLDGTLIDSETQVAAVLPKFYEQYGIDYNEELSLRAIGRTSADMHKILVEEYNFKIPYEEFQRLKTQFERDNISEIPLTSGAEKLVNHFSAKNIPIAIATNSLSIDAGYKMAYHQSLFDKFHHITTKDAVDVGKPDPKIYRLCLFLFPEKYEPDETLVFEDSLSGATAAVRAGMNVVFILNPRVTEEDTKPFVKCVNSLADFDPAEFGFGEYDDDKVKQCSNK